MTASLAQQGVGLVYAFEPMVLEQLRAGTLVRVLERYAPTVPGFFLYFPSVARRSAPLRLFVEAAKELAAWRGDDDSRWRSSLADGDSLLKRYPNVYDPLRLCLAPRCQEQ